jgi:hypothetical protein
VSVRIISNKDYHLVASWYSEQRWESSPELVLPDTGILVDNVAVCWLYLTNSNLAVIAYIAGNPRLNRRAVFDGIQLAVQGAEDYAQDAGYTVTHAQTEIASLQRKLSKLGYVEEATTGRKHYWKVNQWKQ